MDNPNLEIFTKYTAGNMSLLNYRKSICGDMWPSDMHTLSSLEIFERVLICEKQASELSHASAMYSSRRKQDRHESAAWDNAAQIYKDEMRVRLGGKGDVFQNG